MHALSPRQSRTAAALVLMLLAIVAMGGLAPRAHAQSTLGVTVLGPGEAIAPGGEALFIIVVTGPGAADAILDLHADGGTVMQQLGLTEGEPGIATAMAWVRRDQPGTVTLVARVRDGAAAAATATFGGQPQLAAAATIQVSLTVDGPSDGAARTWLFEVLDGNGILVDEVVVFTSGDAPTDTVTTSILPPGAYTVRRAADASLTDDCGDGGFYEVVSPSTGAASITLGDAGTAPVAFRFAACSSGTGGGPSSTPTQLVAGSRTDGSPTPLPPATGAGAAPGGRALPWWAFAGVLLVMTGVSGWVVSARTPRVSSSG